MTILIVQVEQSVRCVCVCVCVSVCLDINSWTKWPLTSIFNTLVHHDIARSSSKVKSPVKVHGHRGKMLLKWSVWPRVRLSRLNHYWPSSFWHTITTTTLIHPFNDLFSRTIWASRHQKGKPFWILLQQQMMGWQWHQLDHMQITCSSLQTDNHASTSLLSFYRPDALLAAQPTVKALKARTDTVASL